jgi:hypothetical protein
MKFLLLIGLTLAILIPTYNYDSSNELSSWKNNLNINNEIKNAVENVYYVSVLRKYIPLSVNLPCNSLMSIVYLTFDLLTDQDILLMTSIFDPANINKEIPKKASFNAFDIMLHILVNNIVDNIQLNEELLSKFRSNFKEKYIFNFYDTKLIYVNVNQQDFQLTLPEYIYFGIYVFIRDKPIEADFEKKLKCIIKTTGNCKYQL